MSDAANVAATQANRAYVGEEAVTPSDTTDLAAPAVSICVSTGGTIRYATWNHLGAAGNTRSIITRTVPDGWSEPIPVLRVYATTDGTTAITASGITVQF